MTEQLFLRTDDLGTISISTLADVTITGTPADNELLVFDSGTAKWINQTPAEALLYTIAEVDAAIAAAVTASDLDIAGDTGTDAIDLDAETLTFAGGTGLDSVITTDTVTFNIDSTVATLTGMQTLTQTTVTGYTTTADTAATTTGLGASLVGIEDSGGLITGTTVETALAENRAAIDAIETDLTSNYQPLDSDLTSWAAITRAANFDTFVATPSQANFLAVITDETFVLDSDIGSGGSVQAWDNELDEIAALLSTDSNFIVGSATGWVAETGATVRTSLDVYSVAQADSAIAAAVTAEDLDFTTDTGGNSAIDLDSQVLSVLGVTGVAVTHSGQTISISTVDAEIDHDSLSGYDADEHINWRIGASPATTETIDTTGRVLADEEFKTQGSYWIKENTVVPKSAQAAWMQIWASDSVPNKLMVQDDAGTDFTFATTADIGVTGGSQAYDAALDSLSGLSDTAYLDEDTLVSDSATQLATQQSIKAYVDAASGAPEGINVLSTGEGDGTKFLREDGDNSCSWQAIGGGGDALVASSLAQFAATTSAEMITLISDETGTGLLVFGTSPTLITPLLGTPTSGVMTNVTGTASGLTAGNVTTNANLTGDVTSVGNATTTITNANLTGDVTSVGNATTTITNANLTGGVTSVGNAATVITNANLTGDVTSSGNVTTTVTNANLTGGVTSVGNAATVITNANLTGHITSSGNATVLGTGSFSTTNLDAALSDGTVAYAGGAFHDGFSDHIPNEHLDWTSETNDLLTTGSLSSDDKLWIKEIAADATNVAAYGQVWVKNDVPNKLHFTDDAGTDFTVSTTADIGVSGGSQAYDADLDTWAGVTPGANVTTFLTTPSSANLASAVTGETGTGALVFATSPTFVTPLLGTPTSGVMTNATGTASGLTAGNVTTNANLSGDVTSSGNTTTIAAKAVDVAMLADGTDGELITWSAAGVAATVAVGTVNHVLTSLGAGAAPTFQAVAPAGNPEGVDVVSSGETGAVKFLREDGDNTCSWQSIGGGGDALTSGHLGQFAATTSLQLKDVISDETGSGLLVFATSPTFTTPILGTPTSGVATNLTGTASGLTAGNVTTNANSTGDVTSIGNATTIAAKAVDVAMLADGTDGELLTWDASGVAAVVAVGTATHVLTSNGVGVPPTFQVPTGGGDALVANGLDQFAATTSLEFKGVISDETGSGQVVFATSPTLVTPALGTPASGVLTNATGLPSILVADESTDTTCFPLFATAASGELGPKTGTNLTFDSATGSLAATVFTGPLTGNADTVSTNANLTGDVTSVGNATTTVTNANLTGGVTSVGNAATVITNANLTGDVTSSGNATTVVTNANLTGSVTSTGNATTVITNANLTGDVTSSGNVTTTVTNANLTGDVTSSGNATTIAAGAVDVAMMANGTDGELLTWGIAGVAETVAVGTANQVLTSNGAGAAPTFETLAGGGDALVANGLDQFAATTSLELKNTISDETGSGLLVFATSPTFTTPLLGTPTSGVMTNVTGTAAGLTAGSATTVVTNANLTGHVTSTGNAAVLGSFTKAQLDAAISDGIAAYSGGAFHNSFSDHVPDEHINWKIGAGATETLDTEGRVIADTEIKTRGALTLIEQTANPIGAAGGWGQVWMNDAVPTKLMFDDDEGTEFTLATTADAGSVFQAWDADLDTWAATTPGTGVATWIATPSSANLLTAVTDETGTGLLVFGTSPTLTTPLLGTPTSGVMTNVTGTASGLTAGNVTTNANLTGDVTSSGNATTIAAGAVDVAMLANGVDGELITWDASAAPATVPVGTIGHVLTSGGTGVAPTFQAGGTGDALVANGLDQFAATTSLELKDTISDETGSGLLVFATSPTFTTPLLGTPTSGVMTNVTGTASGLTAGNVTTNANLTGHVTSSGNAAVLGSFTAAQLDTAISDGTVPRTATITMIIDGGGVAITTGVKGDLSIPFACTIQSVTLLSNESGSIVVDIWKDSYTNYPPIDGDSITASAVPTISTAVKATDATLTGWNTAIAADDTLRFNVDSITTCTRVTISLEVLKT